MTCKQGATHPGRTSIVLQRGETIEVFKDVPVDIRDICDEYVLSEPITRRALELGERAVAQGAEIEVLRFAA